MLKDGLGLCCRQQVGRGGVGAERVVGVRLDDDPLPLVGSLHGSRDFVEDSLAVDLKLGRAGLKQLVGRNFDGNLIF